MGIILDKLTGNPLLIEVKEADLDSASQIKLNQLDGSAIVKQGTISGNVNGDARGENATDFQLERFNSDEVAGYTRGFIAGGYGNKIKRIVERDTIPTDAHVEGKNNQVYEWHGHAEGAGCINDGKISHVEGNAVICSANDSHAEGNRTVSGRRYFNPVTSGSEDAGDGLGVLQFILINDSFGNVSAHFPNALIDAAFILANYGTGAKKDVKGNVYSSAHTAAIWTGDVPTTNNDLKWAMHIYGIARGASESEICFIKIAKCTYAAGVGTKVYYFGAKPYTTLIAIYGSCAPTVLVNGVASGNGHHSEGIFTQTWGYGAHAEGVYTMALNSSAHAEGLGTKASGAYSHSEGVNTIASGEASHAEGATTIASGQNSHSEGRQNTASGQDSHVEGSNNLASGEASHSEGSQTTASGVGSHARGGLTTASANYSSASGQFSVASGLKANANNTNTKAIGEGSFSINEKTEAIGNNSFAKGKESKALRANETAYASAKRAVVGDDQIIEITYSRTCADVGWWEITLLEAVEDGKIYHFNTMVIGSQIAGSAGTVGDSFAYKFEGLVQRTGSTYNVLGTPIRTQIGRSTGMSGDGLTTGNRMSWVAPSVASARLQLRYDGVLNTTLRIQTYSRIQELSVL